MSGPAPNHPRITVTLPNPHEMTSRAAKVLFEEGMLGEFIAPLSLGRLRVPGRIESAAGLAQWRYDIPTVSGAAFREIVVAGAFKAMAGRRWATKTAAMAQWRAAGLDEHVARRMSERRPSAMWVLHGRTERAARTAVSLGIPLIHFLNNDAWGIAARLRAEAARASSPEERANIEHEAREANVRLADESVRRAGLVLVESERMARQARASGGEDKPILVLGQGVDADYFVPGVARQGTAPLQIAQVSRVAYGKGVHVTNEAVRLAGDAVESCVLAGWDGDTSPGLVRRSTSIRFTGGLPRSGVRDLLQRADVFVLPTFADPMPRVVLEAMACGLPVITTADSGHEDLIDDGVNGFIVPEGDAGAVAGILRRLAGEPDLRARVGAAARLTAEANDWDAFAERFRTMLRPQLLPALGLAE